MKRDMELIRKILFYIEENYIAGQGAISIEIDGYSSGEIYEHCQLAYESGLIKKPLDVSTCSGAECMVNSLTNAGYDFLDKIRNDTIWSKVKETAKNKGIPLLIETIKTISTAIITAMAEGVANSIIKNGGVVE